MLGAILWDVDGTLAETERDGHLKAFNQAFEALGVAWRWSDARYAELLKVAGGRERLLHDMQGRTEAPADSREREALAARVHHLKNTLYAGIVARGGLPLREGVRDLLADCARAHVRMGIVTTTSRSNVEALLENHLGVNWESAFAAVVCAADAPLKKPHPQAYLLALARLQLPPQNALAMEDAPAGVDAALAAGIPVIVTRSAYFAGFEPKGALAWGPSLGAPGGWHPAADSRATRIDLEQISAWHSSGR
jgi:HAD superfamily hydrolase (TIGR01509 family)